MKKKILFVNESSKTQALQYMLESLREIWDMRFVESEADLWNSLADGNYNAIVYDSQTPRINVIKLLQEVSVRYPQLIRVIAVSSSDQELILKMIRSNHKVPRFPGL